MKINFYKKLTFFLKLLRISVFYSTFALANENVLCKRKTTRTQCLRCARCEMSSHGLVTNGDSLCCWISRVIPDISTRVLSSTLRTLEADDLIVRKVYPEIPPRVEYSLTPMGKELVPIVQELTAWASKNLPTIMKHRQQFEE